MIDDRRQIQVMANRLDSEKLRQTDICDCRVASATENLRDQIIQLEMIGNENV